MSTMKRIFAPVLLAAVAAAAGASEDIPLLKAPVDLGDQQSLQRGARTFVNYCVSCHSASFMRYSRLGEDLGLTPEQVEDNLILTNGKIGDLMTVALKPADGAAWLGVPPPDLSVVARARGADWLYTFLLTFYLDPAKPTGVNNLAFKDTAMPHVLWELQGLQRAVMKTEAGPDGTEHEVIEGFEIQVPGRESETEYRRTVRDLVNFLVYLGEPAKLVRHKIGAWVIAFLCVFTLLAWLMKREYWSDVH